MSKIKLRNRDLLFIDLIIYFAAYAATIAISFPLPLFPAQYMHEMPSILITAAIHCCAMVFFKMYYVDWIFAGTKEYVKLILATLTGGGISIVAAYVVSQHELYKEVFAANAIINSLIVGSRFLIRGVYKLSLLAPNRPNAKRVLVIGAGRLAVMLLRDISTNTKLSYSVVGLIDDDPLKLKAEIYGSKIIGTRNDIMRICKEKKVEEIIFAIYHVQPKDRRDILEICSQTGCEVKILHGVEENLYGLNQTSKLRSVEIEDLLEREPVVLDNELISKDIFGKTVLVTGGGGSIGSELCRQIIKYNPQRLVILDIYENSTYELQNELEKDYPHQQLDVIIASVRDKKRIEQIFEYYHPDFVFHAAAHKHVPLMEYSPAEAIKNNVFGTYNVATCAGKYGAHQFVLISTDKAVNPTNIMGATKRVCEMIVQTLQKQWATEFVAVRFGNVLGSNGSVIPHFKKQIAAGGPVTVTHPEITRFFMTIPEAAQLVLQAASYAKGGEIFILDMGEPVKIHDLAKRMITLSGFVPDEDIEIKFTGLRPGEKLYEELLMNEEGLEKTRHAKIFIGQPIDIDADELVEKLKKLENIDSHTPDEIRKIMAEVVPTYIPTSNK